jgi:hypothetical protein
MMKSIAAIAVLAGAATASAEILLEVDVSVTDQVTITATDGVSAITASGSDTIGVFLEGILDGSSSVTDTLVSGDLTSALNSSDLTPQLFTAGADTGLNIFSYTDDLNSDFIAGEVAFSGSGTWDLDAPGYAAFAAPGATGDIIFPADSSDDVGEVLGQWVVVPAPGAAGLLGLAGLAAVRRRR